MEKLDKFILKLINLTKEDKIIWEKLRNKSALDTYLNNDNSIYNQEGYQEGYFIDYNSKKIVLFLSNIRDGFDFNEVIDMAITTSGLFVEYCFSSELSNTSSLWRLLNLVKRKVYKVDEFIDTFLEEK